MNLRIIAMLGVVCCSQIYIKSETDVQKQKVSENDRNEIIGLVEKYLNSITEFQGEFEQFVSKTGEVYKGQVYIRRPEFVRVEYKAPNPYVLVIDQKNIYSYDSSLKEETVVSKKTSPFSMFLNKNISLRNFNIIDVSVDHEHIYMQLASKKNDGGVLHLVFNENPIRLYQWRIEIDKNHETIVTLTKYKNKIDESLSTIDLKNCKKKLNRSK